MKVQTLQLRNFKRFDSFLFDPVSWQGPFGSIVSPPGP